jgi:hypothetical protein
VHSSREDSASSHSSSPRGMVHTRSLDPQASSPTRRTHAREPYPEGTRTSSPRTACLARATGTGNQVDDGTYEIIDEKAFVIEVSTFHYRIDGNAIIFDPVLPSDCSTKRCREAAGWSLTLALPGTKWKRAG